MEDGITSNKILAFAVLILALIAAIIFFSGPNDNKLTINTKTDVESIIVNPKNISLTVGKTYTLSVIVSPSTATNKNVTFTSTDATVATVDQNGNVKAIKVGTATIIVASNNGKKSNCVVNVTANKVPITSITLNQNDVTLVEGESITLKANITPTNATEHGLTWTSSNPSVATVTGGKVTAKKVGTTLITVMTENKKIAICDIEVKPKVIEVSSVSLNVTASKIKIGEVITLSATITPNSATDKSLKWTSSNNSVATVLDGKVTAKNVGETTITVQTKNNKTATAKITIYQDTFAPITEKPALASGFTEIVSYNSSTFKYRIQKKNSADYVLIWVQDSYQQLNSAMPQFGKAFKAEDTLKYEISTYGYASKGLVAINASFFWAGWGSTPGIPYVLSKGKVMRDVENKKYSNVYGTLGVDKNGMFQTYQFSNSDYSQNISVKNKMTSAGIRNTFAFAMTPISADGSLLPVDTKKDSTNRNVICQVNKNNFVIYSGSGLSLYSIGKELKDFFGCIHAINLDGGGSRKLYYKTSTMPTAKKVFGGDRATPDMLYFVEK